MLRKSKVNGSGSKQQKSIKRSARFSGQIQGTFDEI